MRTYVQIMCTDNNFEIALILVESQIDYCLVLTSRPRALLSERKEEGRGLVDSLCPSATRRTLRESSGMAGTRCRFFSEKAHPP
jgi:hypothetical protein